MKLHTFFFCIVNLHVVSRHFLFCSAINQVHVCFANAKRRSDAVNGHVSATDHHHPFPFGVGISSKIDF
jgi:hypothetical protein